MQILNWPFVLSDGFEYMLLIVILLIETWEKNVILIPTQRLRCRDTYRVVRFVPWCE